MLQGSWNTHLSSSEIRPTFQFQGYSKRGWECTQKQDLSAIGAAQDVTTCGGGKTSCRLAKRLLRSGVFFFTIEFKSSHACFNDSRSYMENAFGWHNKCTINSLKSETSSYSTFWIATLRKYSTRSDHTSPPDWKMDPAEWMQAIIRVLNAEEHRPHKLQH